MKKFKIFIMFMAALCAVSAVAWSGCADNKKQPSGDIGGNGQGGNEEPTVGTEVGDICPDFSVKTYFGANDGTFTLDDCKGKVTVINFWYTKCSPCISEMPYFVQLSNEQEDVQVLVVHSATNIPTDGKVSDFIEDKGWTDSSIIFCQDDPTADVAAYDTLGGVDSFPYTVVIDAEGIIAHKFDSAKIESYDELLDPVLDAMK